MNDYVLLYAKCYGSFCGLFLENQRHLFYLWLKNIQSFLCPALYMSTELFHSCYFMSHRKQNIFRDINFIVKSFKRVVIKSFIDLLTYLLHGAESFLRSEPVNFAASQEIPRIYGTRKLFTVPTSARHLSLS